MAGVGRQRGIDADRFDRGVATTRRFRPGRGAHGGDDDVIGRRLDGDDGIAGVDRALEGVAALHGHHVRDLGHAEQRGDAGHQILAERGARPEHMAVAGGELGDLWGEHLRDRVGVGGVGDDQDLRHAGDLRGFGGDGCRVGGEHDDVDRFGLQRLRGGHALGGGGVELAVEVFGDDQDFGHVEVSNGVSSVRKAGCGLRRHMAFACPHPNPPSLAHPSGAASRGGG